MKRFLLVGQTGVGKSSFVNATFGSYLSKTSKYEPCTKTVEKFALGTPYGDISLVDTPGLAEDDEAKDRHYLKQISKFITRNPIDNLLYVTTLSENRFRPQEKQTLRLLVEELGHSNWGKSWLILTFAARVEPDDLFEVVNRRQWDITSFLRKEFLNENFEFKECFIVDNIVPNWSEDCIPIALALSQF